MSRIFITGDTHGDEDIHKLNTKRFPIQKELSKDDYVIIAGDFGVIWNSNTSKLLSRQDKYLLNWYNQKNYTTLWIDGNHENHCVLNQFPIETWNDGKVHKISDSVIHLMRGQVYNINEKTFFTMGGADSVDKYLRIKNVSWWPEEMPSYEEYQEAMNNLEKVNFKVDYVITHCCGTQLLPRIYDTQHSRTDELTQFLWHLEKDFGLQFKHWYFGHHHRDIEIDDKHTCLYNNIVEV